MGKVRTGFAEVGLVDLLDGGVLVGLADGVAFVERIEDFRAFGTDVIYADPLYRSLLPEAENGTSPKEFHDIPTESYSGRLSATAFRCFLGKTSFYRKK